MPTSPTQPQDARRVLIIDNDEGMSRAIATRLESLGYVCPVAQSGEDGLAVFDSDPTDLVVTDLNMPTLNGVALVNRIRSRSNVPIIIVTGFRDDYNERIQWLRGVTLLEKPFATDALIELVELELSSHDRRQAG